MRAATAARRRDRPTNRTAIRPTNPSPASTQGHHTDPDPSPVPPSADGGATVVVASDVVVVASDVVVVASDVVVVDSVVVVASVVVEAEVVGVDPWVVGTPVVAAGVAGGAAA